MADQLVEYGTVTGFVAGHPDYAIISNGPHQVYAYITGPVTNVKVGQTFSVYKSGNTYFVGQEVPGK